MRALPCLLACSLIAAPAIGKAQSAPDVLDIASEPKLAPLPTVEPAAPAPEPAVAKPPPAPVTESKPAVATTAPTVVAPDIVAKPDKDGLGEKLGTVVGGVAGGAAGAAVAGPVGKFAGGLLGRKLVQGVLGGKDDIPQVTAVAKAPSAEFMGQPAVAAPATAPPLDPPLKQAMNEGPDAL